VTKIFGDECMIMYAFSVGAGGVIQPWYRSGPQQNVLDAAVLLCLQTVASIELRFPHAEISPFGLVNLVNRQISAVPPPQSCA
jgi:hypothetical protein